MTIEECPVHGDLLGDRGCRTAEVLALVDEERQRQYQEYGANRNLLDGTGPHTDWTMSSMSAKTTEYCFRSQYEDIEKNGGTVSWMHLVREEVAEAFCEDDPVRLREELLQVAALCVSWVEKLLEREDEGKLF